MVTTTSLKAGESLTIGLYFNNNYQLPTTCNLIVFIGGVCVGNLFTQEPEIERVGIYYTIRLSSQDTSKMRGYRDLIVVLDDPDGFGNKKFIVGGILFDRMADEFITTSENQGYNMLIGMTVDESIVSGNVELIEAIKGDKGDKGDQGIQGFQGDPFLYEDFTPAQIAELQQPATEAIIAVNEAEALRVTAETTRVENEVTRQENVNIIIQNAEIAIDLALEAASIADSKVDKSSIVYITQIEYEMLADNGQLLPDIEYNIYEE